MVTVNADTAGWSASVKSHEMIDESVPMSRIVAGVAVVAPATMLGGTE